MDDIFDQILEIIQKLDGVKDQYYHVLFHTCLDAADLLIGNCNFTPKINGFVNKMFKMADKYMSENNKVPGNTDKQLSRTRINSTYEAFRKKKEQLQGIDKPPDA